MTGWIKRRWLRFCAFFSLVASMVAGSSYDLGGISTYVPPKYKVPVMVGAMGLFGLFQLIQSSKPKPPKEIPEQIIRVYHHFPE